MRSDRADPNCCEAGGAARDKRSGLQCPVEKRQAHVHPVVDVGVVVVELLVGVADAGRGEALRQDARAVVDMVLVAPAAVDIDAA